MCKNKNIKQIFGIVAIFAIFIAIPILLNIFLAQEPIIDIMISESVWVGFWGCYLGTFVTLLCLMYTMANNRYQFKLDAEFKRKEKIKDDITERIGLLRISKFLEKPFVYIENLNVQEQSLYLLEQFDMYQSAQDTADLLYNNSNASSKQLAFYNKYTECLNSCIVQITLALGEIHSLNPAKGLKNVININIISAPVYFKATKDAAADFIREIDEGYQSMTKWGPCKIVRFMFQK